jgi:hypothetical protein
MIDRKERYLAAYPGMIKALQDATLGAKRDRLGMYELGVYGCSLAEPKLTSR